jgi:hypothetical protein
VRDTHSFVTVVLEKVNSAPATDRQIEESLALLEQALEASKSGRDTQDTAQVLLARSLLFGKAKRFNECLEDAQRVVELDTESYVGYAKQESEDE